MAGFFGLFGGKTKYVDGNGNDSQADNGKSQEAFFLNPDDAKTLGNIDYMRKSYKIRRTFPKTKSNQVTEFIQEISSIDKISGQPVQPTSSQVSEPKSETPSQSQSTPVRRGADSSMDMFRNMAREIKK